MKRRGSVMLEAVLVLPLFIFIVFFFVQSAFVWTARQMTVYASYCAARAALVYNPSDCAGGGVAKRAACEVLGWISFSHKGTSPIEIPTTTGEYVLPASHGISDQVSVAIVEKDGGLPAVTAMVDFKYPLIIPLGGLLYVRDSKTSGGFVADTEDGWHYLRISESYTLPRPYRTETFPLIPEEDRRVLGLDGGTTGDQLPIEGSPILPPDIKDYIPRVPQPRQPWPEPVRIPRVSVQPVIPKVTAPLP